MSLKIYCPNVENLGDLLNCFPVVSGLAKSLGDQVRFVVHDSFRKIVGFREFMDYQPFMAELVFRSEVVNMDESSYIVTTYSEEEFRSLKERPNRPTETMRHEKFIRDNYPDLKWEVNDKFEFAVNTIGYEQSSKYIVGDRWSKVLDTRRDWNILNNSGLFDDAEKFEFLDYEKPLMHNAALMFMSLKPFIATFTANRVFSDLIFKKNYCLWDDSMINWNNAAIEYSYWKHYYADRPNQLFHLSDPFLRTL